MCKILANLTQVSDVAPGPLVDNRIFKVISNKQTIMFMRWSSGGTIVPHPPLKFSEVGSPGVRNPPLPEIFRGGVHGPHLCEVSPGASTRFVFYDFHGLLLLGNYNNNSYTREPSIKILQSSSNWLVDYICNVLLENTSLIWTCHYCRWRAVKLGLCSAIWTI